MDLVIEQGRQRFAVEVKTARATSGHLVRAVRGAMEDIGAGRAVIVDQAGGQEALTPEISRRGFETVIDWLP